jgi:hypothetical protein
MKKLLPILGAALLLCVLPAHAADVDEGDNGNAPPGARTTDVVATTEVPSPVLPMVDPMPQYWITIDLRPTAFSFNPNFMNHEMPTPIIPKGFGVKIIVPDPIEPDSGCNARQTKACAALCKKNMQKLVACEVDIVFNDDGTTTRTLLCTGYTPGTTPEVAGSRLITTEYKIAD